MIIAYTLFGQDNDSYMFDDDSYTMCSECNNRIGFELSSNFRLTKKKYDISYTYDGYLIVSDKFKRFCEENGYSDISFIEIKSEPNFYFFQVSKILQFDYERRNVEFIKFCNHCNQYDEIIGVTPAYLKNVEDEITEGFYRTDLVFGSGNDKSPLIIIGTQTFEKMKKHKFKGMDCDPIML